MRRLRRESVLLAIRRARLLRFVLDTSEVMLCVFFAAEGALVFLGGVEIVLSCDSWCYWNAEVWGGQGYNDSRPTLLFFILLGTEVARIVIQNCWPRGRGLLVHTEVNHASAAPSPSAPLHVSRRERIDQTSNDPLAVAICIP